MRSFHPYTLMAILLAALLLTACSERHYDQGPKPVVFDGSRQLVDEQRSRTLPLQLWYPSDLTEGDKKPLLIFAHGAGGRPAEGTWLGEYMASHGYVVIALQFPFTNRDNFANLDLNDLLNQPADVSRVIDAASGLIPGLPEQLVAHIDNQRIALAGHSFGGLTTFLSTYDREFKDPRINSAILLAAGGGDFLGPDFFAGSDTPMLLLHGDKDLLVQYQGTSAAAFAAADVPKVLVRFSGGTHMGFGNSESYGFNPDLLACWLSGDMLKASDDVHFYQDLHDRKPDTGIIAFVAPLPCTFEVSDVTTMSNHQQRRLALPLIHRFIDETLKPTWSAQRLYQQLQNIAQSHPELSLKTGKP